VTGAGDFFLMELVQCFGLAGWLAGWRNFLAGRLAGEIFWLAGWLEKNRNPMDFNAFPANQWEINGNLWKSMETNGNLWKSMGTCGNQWTPMEINGNQRRSM
jgi:hypothetical protein